MLSPRPPLLAVLLLSSCTGLSYYEPSEDKGTDDAANVDDGEEDGPGTENETDAGDDDDDDDDDDAPSDDDDAPSDDDDDDTDTTDTTDGTPGDDDDDDDTVPPPAPVALDAIDPAFGSTAGGTRVTLEGEFNAATEVLFDGLPANVISQTATEMEVETPASAEGWVDVEVNDTSSSATLNSAYQYWLDGSGQSGTFGFMTYVEIVGGYWNPAPSPIAQSLVTFTQPGGWEIWQDYTTSLDTCVFNHVVNALPLSYDPGASYVDLDNGGSITRLNDASAVFGAGFYGDQGLTPGVEVVPGASYDLLTVPGNANWPAFTLPNFVEVPNSFNVTSPDLDRANPPAVQAQIDFVWGGGGGDYMLIYILRQYLVGGTWTDDGVVTCAVYDDGAFTLPGATWPSWFVGDFLHVQMGRVYQSSGVLPYNNAENRAAGIYWFYGGADTVQ